MGDSTVNQQKRKNMGEVEGHSEGHPWWREAGDAIASLNTVEEFLEEAKVLHTFTNSGVGKAIRTVGPPLSAVSGLYEVVENLGAKNRDAVNIANAVAGGAELSSGMIGTMGVMGAPLAPIVLEAGLVAGAGAGGYKAGQFLDRGADWIGDKITGNEKADHSISEGLSRLPDAGEFLADKLFDWRHKRDDKANK